MENETNVNSQQPNEPTNTEPAGASTGGGDPKPTTPAQNTESNNKELQKATEKDDIPSSEELAEFRKWQESQKSEAEKARLAAEERAAAAELKLTAMSKGVSSEALGDVIALAKTKITDKVTTEQVIDEIIKKYPAFTESSKPGITTGVRTGGNTPPASSAKAIDIIRAEQVKRK